MNMYSRSGLLAVGAAGASRPAVGGSVAGEFRRFRESHPISRRTVSRNDWNFIVTGAGGRTVVVFPGYGGDAESMFPVVSALEPEFRVIALGYPPTAAMVGEIVEGVRVILDGCGVEQCCVLGHSLGGMVVRAFAQAYPQRVDALIIANSADCSPGRTRLLRLLLPVALAVPRSVLGRLICARFKYLLQGLPAPDREFWLGYVRQCETMHPRSRGLRSQGRCLLDFLRSARNGPATSAGWPGRVLILESDGETGFTLRERERLRRRYPGAAVHIFRHAGHLSFITHTREFVETVSNFLAETKD